jgi:hypothetical protein
MRTTKDERLDKLLRHRAIQPASIDLAIRIIRRSKDLRQVTSLPPLDALNRAARGAGRWSYPDSKKIHQR